MKESDQDKRQRRAQNAVKAIAESGDPPSVIRSELTRLQQYLNVVWDEAQDSARGWKDDDFEVRPVMLHDVPPVGKEQGREARV